MSVHPAVARAQRNAKNTRKQMEDDRLRKQEAVKQHNDPVIRRRSNKPVNAAAVLRNIIAPPPPAPKVEKEKPTKKPTNKEILALKKRRITPEARRGGASKGDSRSESPPPSPRRPPPPNRAKQRHKQKQAPRKQRVTSDDKQKAAKTAKESRSGFTDGARVITPEHKDAVFEEYVYVKKGKTAKQLLDEKRAAMLARKQGGNDDREYEKIKQERLKEDHRVRKAKKKTVDKAKITDTRSMKREGDEDGSKKYKIEYKEDEMESWDSDIEIEPQHIKDIDQREARRRVDKVMQRIGKGNDPSERIKVKDRDKDRFVLEDLGNQKSKSRKQMPIVDIKDLNLLVNPSMASAERRDILLVGVSESAKDTIIDCILDTQIGIANKIFDTTLEENEDKDIPDDNVAIFSEKVPILALKDREDYDSSDEDGTQARRRALAKKKKMAEEDTKAAKKDRAKVSKNKVVKAMIEKQVVEDNFVLSEDFPSVRLVILTKVSANDRVDIRDLHQNIARFVPFERFKKKFKKLNRYECLIIDQSNNRQIYRMEFA